MNYRTLFCPVKFALIFILAWSWTACEKEQSSRREEMEAILHPDSQIELSLDTTITPEWFRGWNYELAPGDKQVAYYRHRIDPEAIIADDEVTYLLLFEFDPNQTEFVLRDSALWRANCLFNALCFCGTRGYYRISKGEITGMQLDDQSWAIDFDIRYDQFQFHDSTYVEERYQGGEIFKVSQ